MWYSLRQSTFCAIVLSGALFGSSSLSAAAQAAPDNTKTNTRDREQGAVTADQQKENADDRAITQKIRQAVMNDKSLSTYAHNVKIVTINGQVTLKGPVRSDDERHMVEAKAVGVAGDGHVTNEMSVAPAKTTTKK